MVVLKANELQWNSNGLTVKTNKQQVKTWRRNVDAHYASLNHTIVTKELSNSGKQHTYILNGNKYTFEYYTTGRILVKTNNLEQLRQTFVDHHESILGVRLEMVGSSLGKYQKGLTHQTVVLSRRRNASSANVCKVSSSSDESGFDEAKVETKDVAVDTFPLEQVNKNQEEEIKDLRSELSELKVELHQLKEDIKVLESNRIKDQPQSKSPPVKLIVERDAEMNMARRKIEAIEKKRNQCFVSNNYNNHIINNNNNNVDNNNDDFNKNNNSVVGGPQVKSVKYLAEQYQKMSAAPKYPRNK